jgi:hypothetical protein
LSKETFVPLCVVFVLVWWVVGRRDWTALSAGGAAVVTITVLQSALAGHVVWPWEFAVSVQPGVGHLRALLDNTLDRNIGLMAMWLLPLGLPRLRLLPKAWIAASGAAAATAIALAVWHSSSAGSAARPLFTAAGPLLSLSAASYLGGRG